ncbi:MAG TPA: DMT family transporter [Bauldia sp.]|nr:DMT family transporter [Bauldia sp.]
MAVSSPRAQNTTLGIGFMLGGILLFSMNDALAKWLSGTYPATEMLLFRSVPAILLLAPMVQRVGWRALIEVERPWLQFARAALGAVETAMFYWAVRTLPLADAMTYYLAGPIYVTVMAAVFLREKVGWRRWSAVLVGFLGVVIALGPSALSFGGAALIALVGSVIYSAFLVMTRVLRGTQESVLASWQVIGGLVVGLIAAPFLWAPVARWWDGALMGFLGVVAVLAILCINRSLVLAPASVVVPYQYTMIIWAVIFGFIFFGNVPSMQTLVGAAIIIGAGLFIFFREQQVGLPAAEEIAPER